MKILIVPDSFKGSLSSQQAAEAIEEGLAGQLFKIEKIPMADGGEGTVDCLVAAERGTMMRNFVTNPIGKKIQAEFGILKDDKTAIIEMASASGLLLISKEKRNPLYTTTYGTGELIRKVIERGYSKIILGLGGSATTDCGAGALQALGVKLLDENGINIKTGGFYLKNIKQIDISTQNKYENIELTFLCDVSNKLLGINGAARVYSQQKGSSLEEVQILEDNIEHFAGIAKRDTGINITEFNGSGAAGGLAAGLSLIFKSHFVSGSEFVINATNLKTKIKNADVIITGEGELNSQTKFGKIPYKIAKIAKKYKKPIIGIFGSITEDAREEYEHDYLFMSELCEKGISKEKAIQNAYLLLSGKVREIFKELQLN
ncbi:MAG: glycerate kinase [Candidatus Tenebribacter burtonii]|jgi:glycerate kinase|nr:glycerate kinase [Candidatus Tenebribacter burtonii]